jgi:hypothetical protein
MLLPFVGFPALKLIGPAEQVLQPIHVANLCDVWPEPEFNGHTTLE